MEASGGSVRIIHASKMYKKIGDGNYIGPEGQLLSAFIEEACDMKNLTKCNLEIYRSQGTKKKEFRQYFTIMPYYDRVESTARNKHMHSITDMLKLTPEGEQYLVSGKDIGQIVYELKLRCGGGAFRGNASGSNCVRIPYRPGWCTGAGECSEWCKFDKTRNKTERLEHMCDFTVSVTATLRDIEEGRRRIYVEGNHGYTRIEDWIPPAIRRPTIHVKERALTSGTLKGPSASTTLSFLNSPSGSASRSFLSNGIYYKLLENYRRGMVVTTRIRNRVRMA